MSMENVLPTIPQSNTEENSNKGIDAGEHQGIFTKGWNKTKDFFSQEVNSAFKKMGEASMMHIQKLSQGEQLKFLSGLSKIGSEITRVHEDFFSKVFKGLAGFSSNSRFLNTYFTSEASICDKNKAIAEKAINESGPKNNLSVLSGMGKGFGTLTRYARILFDAGVANPFRHITASAMFIGRRSEALKETRFNYEGALENTRVHDKDIAYEEAWDLYEKVCQKSNGHVESEDLRQAYQENLPADLVKRINRTDYAGLGFIGKIMNKHMGMIVNHFQKEIDKIENSNLNSSENKEKAKQDFMAKKKAVFDDLDRIVGDQGTIDTLAYLARLTEKTGKGVGMVMTLDSLYRFAQLAPRLSQTLTDFLADSFSPGEAQATTTNFNYITIHGIVEKVEKNESLDSVLRRLLNREEPEKVKKFISQWLKLEESDCKNININSEIENALKKVKDHYLSHLENSQQPVLLTPGSEVIITNDGKYAIKTADIDTGKMIIINDDEQSELTKQTNQMNEQDPRGSDSKKFTTTSDPVSFVSIDKKHHTLSAALYEAVKNAQDETKDKFISRYISNPNITDKNRGSLLSKAIRKMSVSNLKLGDGDDVRNLVYAGNRVVLHSDGTFEVEKGTAPMEAGLRSEERLRKNSQHIITSKNSGKEKSPAIDDKNSNSTTDAQKQIEKIPDLLEKMVRKSAGRIGYEYINDIPSSNNNNGATIHLNIKNAPDYDLLIKDGKIFVDGPAGWNHAYDSLEDLEKAINQPLIDLQKMETRNDVPGLNTISSEGAELEESPIAENRESLNDVSSNYVGSAELLAKMNSNNFFDVGSGCNESLAKLFNNNDDKDSMKQFFQNYCKQNDINQNIENRILKAINIVKDDLTNENVIQMQYNSNSNKFALKIFSNGKAELYANNQKIDNNNYTKLSEFLDNFIEPFKSIELQKK